MVALSQNRFPSLDVDLGVVNDALLGRSNADLPGLLGRDNRLAISDFIYISGGFAFAGSDSYLSDDEGEVTDTLLGPRAGPGDKGDRQSS